MPADVDDDDDDDDDDDNVIVIVWGDVTDQESQVDEHEQHFDAHRPGALAVSRRALFTAQFNDTLTCRLHGDGSRCRVDSAATTSHFRVLTETMQITLLTIIEQTTFATELFPHSVFQLSGQGVRSKLFVQPIRKVP